MPFVIYALGISLHIGQRICSAHLPMAGPEDAEKHNIKIAQEPERHVGHHVDQN
jgi:hypothetical protein